MSDERSLRDRLSTFPEAWAPQPGVVLEGVIVGLDERDGGFGVYPIVSLRTDDDAEVTVHAFHTVLKGELAKQRPAVGERIGLAYHGKSADGRYERYRCIVDRPSTAPDWNRIAAEAEAEAAQTHETGSEEHDGIPF